MRRRVIVVLIAAVLTSLTLKAEEQTVNNCRVIDQPGSYRLQKVITASSDLVPVVPGRTACIFIAADFVTLDLQGYTIVGAGYAVGGVEEIGIATYQTTGVVIRNGSVTNFETGIWVDGFDHTVAQMRLVKNTDVGLEFSGNGFQILSNSASENFHGMLGHGADHQITGNVANRNREIGIFVLHGGARVVGNTANNNGQFGIYVTCSALILQNMARANGPHPVPVPGFQIVTVGLECVRLENNPVP